MSDAYTQLNQGMGGDVMDEAGIQFPDGPSLRKRPRVVITGETKDAIAEVTQASPTGDEYALLTRVVPAPTAEQVVQYGTVSLVSATSETTICSYTVPTGKRFYFLGVHGSGQASARFRVYTDSSPILTARSTAAAPNVMIAFSTPAFSIAEGTTIYLKVTHFEDGILPEFDGTIIGQTH